MSPGMHQVLWVIGGSLGVNADVVFWIVDEKTWHLHKLTSPLRVTKDNIARDAVGFPSI